ncbi:RNA 2',3'-cyclic phosphodiesterase [Candidatus Parcubacteria bacterium]|nr:RNA 2',3'-cyclic phosphodiesterase [Candidatus Parcubacteria bacterium]
MKHRVFIAINLPEDIKKKLAFEQEEIESSFDISPMRWTRKDNLHITLAFLGYVQDDEIVEICQLTKSIVQKQEPFSLNLTKICYGPPEKMPPRMIWATGEKSQELAKLKTGLEMILLESENSGFKNKEGRAFSPHITLGRIRAWQWKQINPEERPVVEKEISLKFDINSIEVMESQLKRGGTTYTILESALLGS